MTPTRAAIEQALPDPAAWVSFDVLTQKERLDRKPITSLQPGVYQHSKLFSEAQMHEFADARVKALEGELATAHAAFIDLKAATSFLAQCRQEHETARDTGAYKDARNWLEASALRAAALSPTTTKD